MTRIDAGPQAPNDAIPALSLAERFADFAVGLRYEDLPVQAVHQSKLLIIDAIACGLAASTTDLHASVTRWLADAAAGPARVFGVDTGVDLGAAVIMNGSLIHALDFDDIPHFGAVELPPAMAIAQQQRVSGEQLVTAIVAGFEVAARVTATLAHGRPQHPVGTVGPIASAVVAALLLGLDRRSTAMAICIAASTGAGLTQNFGTFTKPLHAGRAAESGLLAARLAAAGWTADAIALEGPKGFYAAYCDPTQEPAISFDGDEAFWITRLPADLAAGSSFDADAWPPRQTGREPDLSLVGHGAPSDRRRGGPNLRRGPSFKPWPACGGNNAVLTAAFELFAQPDVHRDDIEQIEIVVPFDPKSGALFRTDDPHDGLQGKFSLRYGVAAAWRDGAVEVASYLDDYYRTLTAEGWFDRVTCRMDPGYIDAANASQPADPDCNWVAVIATMRDGATRTGWAYNRGLEMSAAAVRDKFLSFSSPRLGATAAAELYAELDSIQDRDDVGELFARSCG